MLGFGFDVKTHLYGIFFSIFFNKKKKRIKLSLWDVVFRILREKNNLTFFGIQLSCKVKCCEYFVDVLYICKYTRTYTGYIFHKKTCKHVCVYYFTTSTKYNRDILKSSNLNCTLIYNTHNM